jgi:hypothetical protein
MNQPTKSAPARRAADTSAFIFTLKFWMRPPDEIDDWAEFVEMVETHPEIRTKFISMNADTSWPSLVLAKDMRLAIETQSIARAEIEAWERVARPC